MRDRRHVLVAGLSVLTAGAVLLAQTPVADACGCLSPPAVTEGDYAVNQSAEQIIFEVEPGWVTAHVLIKYAGDPAQFAWIIPVPEVPELAISPVSAFGILDKQTAPNVFVTTENICPISEWKCAYHDAPNCGGGLLAGGDEASGGGVTLADAGAGGAPGEPVDVINEQVVGDYQTVTFRASEAGAATQWLRDNGFIVNQTTSIYMESYVNQNMVFVAAKLVPGAGVKAIKPLKMRYRAAFPMVPLILTAVAAEPHLTVTSFIYSDKVFRPMGHPIVTINEDRIARDSSGRINYPQVLARTIDEAGGDGFVIEYAGNPVTSNFNQNNGCCNSPYDFCGISNDSQCQCPGSEIDANDCANTGDLADGIKLLDDLSQKYSALTRITTRVSADEMTFDPQYEPHYGGAFTGRLSLRGSQPTLLACSGQVIDKVQYTKLQALQRCAATYCGEGGFCAATEAGSGCQCAPGFVSQRFTDLDGVPSVTCIPEVPPVDLRAGGFNLPDACVGVSCGMGQCVDRNGVAVCKCNEGAVAVGGNGVVPSCEPLRYATHTVGGQDYSEALRGLAVCAPPPPQCGADGWLVKETSPRPGVACGDVAEPAPWLTQPKPKPTCGPFGCGGCEASDAGPMSLAVAWVVIAVALRPRRRRTRGS